MKKIIVFISVFLYADISSILFKINQIEESKKIFLPMPHYNIFTSSKVKSFKTIEIYSASPIKIYALFNDLVNINGRWFRVGENVNGYKIIKVSDKKIILKKDNKYIILKPTIKFIKVSK